MGCGSPQRASPSHPVAADEKIKFVLGNIIRMCPRVARADGMVDFLKWFGRNPRPSAVEPDLLLSMADELKAVFRFAGYEENPRDAVVVKISPNVRLWSRPSTPGNKDDFYQAALSFFSSDPAQVYMQVLRHQHGGPENALPATQQVHDVAVIRLGAPH